jgi:hypothetical protein
MLLGIHDALLRNPLRVTSMKSQKLAMLFTRRESPPETDKPMTPHLQRCQGFAVAYYGFTLDALDLRHPRLLQH